MSIVLVGSTSGSITLQEPAVAGTTVLDLPAVSGTIVTTGSPQSGSVLQVVVGTDSTPTITTSTSYVDTGLTATITPKFATSKILILMQDTFSMSRTGVYADAKLQILRGATAIYTQPNSSLYTQATGASYVEIIWSEFLSHYDSPSTTSATTYKVQMFTNGGTALQSSYNGNQASITLMEIAA